MGPRPLVCRASFSHPRGSYCWLAVNVLRPDPSQFGPLSPSGPVKTMLPSRSCDSGSNEIMGSNLRHQSCDWVSDRSFIAIRRIFTSSVLASGQCGLLTDVPFYGLLSNTRLFETRPPARTFLSQRTQTN